eukprot:CAMPEP_0197024714 /NCGR_PEP_ID=MMETSP1384-20130603/5216_1 /TAXON_ID=29189 /ORGANISM="Ammonia sp." /LENGTH=310 /DNA_ID=CAMNT_0042453143 /DNA_START=139 /DNA_END=1071 /DNA_ORIENTATION=+
MTLVLVRHGESDWNKRNLFSGWVDCELAAEAVDDTKRATQLIAAYMASKAKPAETPRGDADEVVARNKLLLPPPDMNTRFDLCYTSVLRRSMQTAHDILLALDELYIPTKRAWRLNERFYGDLTGQSRVAAVDKYGKQSVEIWRRSYDVRPPVIADDNEWNPRKDKKYWKLADFDTNKDFPTTESLKDVIDRVQPLWQNEILPLMKQGKNVLLSIHGTSLRAIITLIENEHQHHVLDKDTISKLEVPNGYPVVYEFNKDGTLHVSEEDMEWIQKQHAIIKVAKVHGRFLGDLDELLVAQNKVKNQIEKKE